MKLPEDFHEVVESCLASTTSISGRIEDFGAETFIGVKTLHAARMSRGEYCALRGWDLPVDENGEDQGMIVQYAEGDKSNVPGFTGYVSWSPLEVFEKSYRRVG